MFFSKFFKKKKPETTPIPVLANLPALNAWGIFFQGNGLTLYNRIAATVPGATPDLIYLKSYPEVFDLERVLFAEWFTTSRTGVYLQQLNDIQKSWSLVYISFNEAQLTVVKSGIRTVNWVSGYEDGTPVIIFKDDNGDENYVME